MLPAMTHRPYPDRGRALRQIMRRHHNQLPARSLPQGPPGEYRLSTRRLG